MMDDPADCDPARGHPERTAAPLAVCPPAVLPAPAAGTAMGRHKGAASPESPAPNRASGS